MTMALETLERSGVFTNNGEQVRRFEAEATRRLFGGQGGCVTVANATLGLILAIKHATLQAPGRGPYALMPSFTFAATAQAAIWAGLTPLLYDIAPETWVPCARAEETQLRKYGSQIAAIVPYATFGNCIDMERYAWLSARFGVAVIVDAAASLGSRTADERGFATGSRLVTVFSMHATKTFATAEGGLIYSADPDTLAALRSMASFGFGAGRSAIMPGLNAKMSEINALLALAKLEEIESVVDHRAMLAEHYRAGLPGLVFQRPLGAVQAQQTMPVLLPARLAGARAGIVAGLQARGIGAATYFSPHLAEQPYFRQICKPARLPVTRDVASRVLALPMADEMTEAEVDTVCRTLLDVCQLHETDPARARGRRLADRPAGAREMSLAAAAAAG